ncbi:OprD family porin [Pseudomonas sp. GCM10022188]|uniref:OprD family porin n=1 Tax=Pseudomonas TaxID=286 RepID=UPI001E6211D9|nr:OprD family porin [Pseudomonas oryzagri]MCC6076232.1 OprD family porin [Pseudomonas oryzagri]
MSMTPLARAVAAATLGAGMILPCLAQAAFVEDSKATLELRNFYFNRDIRQDSDPAVPTTVGKPTDRVAKQEEWGQGFIVRVESGFTEGTIGVGVDALGTLGVKLDSGRGTSGTGVLLRDRETGEAQDTYGDLGVTAKFKASNSVLKVGTVMPNLPTISGVDNRLLPTSYQGGYLNSQEIAGLALDLGMVNRINYRDSQDHETMTLARTSTRNGLAGRSDSDQFVFGGLTYKWNSELTTAYHYGNLDELYKQHIFNLVHVLPIADAQNLKTDLRFAKTSEEDDSNVDNNAFGAMFTYALKAHKFGLGYQAMTGDTGYAFINGNNPFLVNYVQIGDFSNTDEQSWQVRYDYDFTSLGIPGLTFMTRYVSGDNFDLADGSEGKEWERNTELKYVFQQGALKNLGVHWRNAHMRSNYASDLDENRLILSYTLPLF